MQSGLQLDGINFSTSALDDKPEWATVLAKIFTIFSLSEGTIGGIYGLIKHQDHEQAVRELKAMGTNHARANAVKTLAKSELTTADAEIVINAIDKALLFAQHRNKIAHGMWGFSPDKPNEIYTIPVKKFINFVASLIPNAAYTDDIIDELNKHVRAFTLAELTQIERDGSQLLQELLDTFVFLAHRAASTMPTFQTG